jgi:hypothetical protein
MNNELQLSVQKLELGTLTTNAIVIRDKVKDMLVNYNADNYNEDTIDKAVKDKATLNTTSKFLNDERIRLEREFMQPFNSFKDVVTETCNLIKEASSKIDVIVKDVENKAKEQRKSTITKIFNEYVKELKDLITLETIFDEKWLNKGSFNKEEFKLEKELTDKIDKIRSDLLTIGELNSKYEVELKNDYLKNQDLGAIIRKNNELNQKEELLKKQEVETKKVVEEQREEKVQEISNTIVKETIVDPVTTYKLEITGRISQHKALKNLLEINKMHTVNIETGNVIVE